MVFDSTVFFVSSGGGSLLVALGAKLERVLAKVREKKPKQESAHRIYNGMVLDTNYATQICKFKNLGESDSIDPKELNGDLKSDYYSGTFLSLWVQNDVLFYLVKKKYDNQELVIIPGSKNAKMKEIIESKCENPYEGLLALETYFNEESKENG